MRWMHGSWLVASLLGLLVGCGPEKSPSAVQPPVSQEEAAQAAASQQGAEGSAAEEAAESPESPEAGEPAEAEQAPAEEQAEQEPAPPPANADFQVTVTRADGSRFEGHVRYLERSEDWFGEQGWYDDEQHLKLDLEGNGTEIMAPWTDVKSIRITPGKVPDDVDCSYDSDFTPWMYDCTLRTDAVAVTKDGKSWKVIDRHKWRLTLDDGQSIEFWIYKHPARQQDSRTVGIDDTTGENYALYEALQERLREELKTLVTRVEISAD